MTHPHDAIDRRLERGAAQVEERTSAFHDLVEWAHDRAASRRRATRTWVAASVAAGLLVSGGAAAALTRPIEDVEQPPARIEHFYRAADGARCTLLFQVNVVGTGDPRALPTAVAEIEGASLDDVETPSGISRLDELGLLDTTLADRAEQAVLATLGVRADVLVSHTATCVDTDDSPTAGPLEDVPQGEDFGREPSDLGVIHHWVAFFRASTGHICEVQIGVFPDGKIDPAVLQDARTFLGSLRVSDLDLAPYLAEESQMFSEIDQPMPAPQVLESNAVIRAAVQLVFDHVATDPLTPGPVYAQSNARCDAEPST